MNDIQPDTVVTVSPAVQQWLDTEHKLLIDGEWVAAIGGHTSISTDPANGTELTTFASGQAEDIDAAVVAARKAFHGPWSSMSNFQRADILNHIAALITENADLFTEIEVLDNGMPKAIARLTVNNIAEMFSYYAGAAQRIEGTTTTPPGHITQQFEALTYTLREPIGVAGLIVPWNVPVSTAVLKLAPALAAGCTVVIKPSEQTPLSILLLGQLCLDAGIPPGVVNIVNGAGRIAGARLAEHPDVDKISFTGSTDVGKKMILASVSNLKKLSLELGGKSPVVVMPDANLELAAPGVAMATFFLQGQNCMAGTRIFIHEDIHDQLLEMIIDFTKQLPIGHGLNDSTAIGPLVSAVHCQTVMNYITTGIEEGATLAYGGQRVSGPGNFLVPAIFTDCTPDMTIVREEIFGPVMAVQRFASTDLDEIAAMANDSIFGLSGSVWTSDLSTAHRLVARIRSGHVSINLSRCSRHQYSFRWLRSIRLGP